MALDFFASLTGEMSGPHSRAAANDVLNNQQRYHEQFVKILSQWLQNAPGEQEIRRTFEQGALSFAQNLVRSGGYVVQQTQDGHRVASDCLAPVFRDEDLDRLRKIKIAPGIDGFDAAFLMLAAYLYAARMAPSPNLLYADSKLGAPIVAASGRLSSIRALSEPSGYRSALGRLEQAFQEKEVGLKLRFDALQRVAANFSGLAERLESLGQETRYLENSIAKIDESHRATLASLQAEQQASLRALREDLRLDEARKLWDERASRAAQAFNISGALLITAMLAIPAAAWLNRTEIVEFLRNFESSMIADSGTDLNFAATVSAIGRLLLVTAPLGFIVWVMRLGVRFNMRSMLLMDDARQRVSMLNTYLFLIEKDAAVKQDRGAILEALFRRPPGHGPDTAEPPHFTELLRFGQETTPKG